MSWSKIARLKLTDNEIESILDAIGAKHAFIGEWSKQDWGWAAECGVINNKVEITFSGAEFSRGCDLPDRFKREARKRGYYKRK